MVARCRWADPRPGGLRAVRPYRAQGEVAKAILFMASDGSSCCLGSELMADGGLSQRVNPA
jgi:NAD(P)-dependent dehydrogenase (short-subunit alcohol dehydrogenase family)